MHYVLLSIIHCLVYLDRVDELYPHVDIVDEIYPNGHSSSTLSIWREFFNSVHLDKFHELSIWVLIKSVQMDKVHQLCPFWERSLTPSIWREFFKFVHLDKVHELSIRMLINSKILKLLKYVLLSKVIKERIDEVWMKYVLLSIIHCLVYLDRFHFLYSHVVRVDELCPNG